MFVIPRSLGLARMVVRHRASPPALATPLRLWRPLSFSAVILQQQPPKPPHSNLPTTPEGIPHEIFAKQQVLSRRVPGETPQPNSLDARFPSSLKLEREAMPTLLPRPGVPEPNKYPLAKLMNALEAKTEPELIYEAEPHRLWFVFCYCFALVFMMYGLNAFHIGYNVAVGMYTDNEMNLQELHKKLQLAMHMVIVTVLSLLPFCAGIAFIFAPTRLIRRIWYLPRESQQAARADGKTFVRFTTHPLLPNRPTPVYTMEVGDLQKSITTKVYSGKGFYGTNDSSFFFFLRASTSRIPFIVDRKGFFWGDGRVMDMLFSNDSVDRVEQSKKVETVYAEMIRENKAKELELKKQYGLGWRQKAQFKLMKEDVQKIKEKLMGEQKGVATAEKKTASKPAHNSSKKKHT